MTKGLDIGVVEKVMEKVLSSGGKAVVIEDQKSGASQVVPVDSAAAADGLLPVFLLAGEAIWREVVGEGFALGIERDPKAMLGYRVDRIGAASLSGPMLAAMEVQAQATRGDVIVVNWIDPVWRAARERFAQEARQLRVVSSR